MDPKMYIISYAATLSLVHFSQQLQHIKTKTAF